MSAIPPEDDYNSEEDGDYVPPNEPDSEDSDDGEAPLDELVKEVSMEDALERKRKRDALWASFQASDTPSNSNASNSTSSAAKEKKMVKVEKRYRFAGKEIVEVVEVAEDSPDAKEWPQWDATGREDGAQDDRAQPASASVDSTPSSLPSTNTPPIPSTSLPSQPISPDPSIAQTSNSVTASTSVSTSTSAALPPTATSAPIAKRPGPRKPRTSLPSLPSASSNKAKKLTTLDKSAMDWRAHVSVQPSDVADELTQNRRGGGYLEKVEFLQRVEERKESVLEGGRGKRRKLGD